MSKIPTFLFLLTAMMTGVLLFCLLRPEPPLGHGEPHTEFSQMNRGGDGGRHTNLIIPAGLYGGLQIVLFVSGLCLGIRRDRSRLGPLIVGGFAYLAVFIAMVGTYAKQMDDVIVFGVPLPTALMVFGMMGVPVVFIVLYIVKFQEWIYNDDDAKRFAELLARRGETDLQKSSRNG